MTVLAFIAVIIVCATIAFVVVWLSKHPVTISPKTPEAPRFVSNKPLDSETIEKANTESTIVTSTEYKKDQEPKIVSMDAVIAAANAIMGIETETNKENVDEE